MLLRILPLLAVLSVFGACRPSPDPSSPLAEPEPSKDQSANVTRMFNENCSGCHGQDMQGGGAGTKSLVSRDKFDQKWDKQFFDTIKNGKPDMGMPAFGGSLSDEAVWALVVHVRELQLSGLRAKEGDPKPDSSGAYASKLHKFKMVDVVTSGLSTPWSLDFLPDGRMLVTNRPGGVLVVDRTGKSSQRVEGTPPAVEIGQGGQMEVAVHPDYAKNGWIYLSFCDPAKSGGGGMTKVVRGKIDFSGGAPKWMDNQTIYEADQKYYSGAGIHFGSKIVFDGRGHVFISVGERGTNMRVQDLETPYGKIMRVNEDGSIPDDNPWPKSPAWTYGHRNPQGLTIDLEGNVWDTEHAPRGGDELNMLQRGANYGWPVVCFGINYNDTPFRVPWPKPDQKIAMPAFRWLPSCAASGLDTIRGTAFPNWKGDLIAGGLAGSNVDRIRVKGGQLVEKEELLHGIGRVRDIAVAADGAIYLVINGPDKVVKLVPAG
ncbi:MAG: PQQ-dependent sugar dehydrogenase [Armatimonadetes bacterium]|nr:PQQ-dependent sugar dehydrogenase [Armatimonadota bacterium]